MESVNRLSNNWALTSEIHTRFQLAPVVQKVGGGEGEGDSAIHRGPAPKRPISTNPGLKVCSFLVFYLLMYCLG